MQLLSSNLIQRGNEHEGFLGFLIDDIKKERRRIQGQHCKYCRKANANISCCKKTCRTFYHLKCGYKTNVLFQFKGTFMSFCQKHYNFIENSRPKKDEICHICQEKLGGFSLVNTIKAPCCNNGWFHKWCLSEYATSAGYFFKCPLCQDEDIFRDKIPFRGVFIPDKDAEWETEPNAFQDLLQRPDICSSIECLCTKGRSYKNNGIYKLKFCVICGSSAVHKRCMKKGEKTKIKYQCIECQDFVSSTFPREKNKKGVPKTSQELMGLHKQLPDHQFSNGMGDNSDKYNENQCLSQSELSLFDGRIKRKIRDLDDDSDFNKTNCVRPRRVKARLMK